MLSQDLEAKPEEVVNLKGDEARGQFINLFKEVQRLKTGLDQYTDLTDENKNAIEQVIPKENLQGFKGVYIETAKRLKSQQDKDNGNISEEVQQLDFEFVLFASAVIDYDYIMRLIAKYSSEKPGKHKMTRSQLIGLIRSDAKFTDDGDDIVQYINSLKEGEALSEKVIRQGYEDFKTQKDAKQLEEIAIKHGIEINSLQSFIGNILQRMIFDGEKLNDLLAPLDLGWKARTQKELALMEDLVPLLKKRSNGRDISGLSAYE